MTKKSFGGGFDSILASTDPELRGEEDATVSSDRKKAPPQRRIQESTVLADHDGSSISVRTTLYISEDLYEQIQAVAYWERQKIKDVLNQSLENYLKKKGEKFVKEALVAYRSRS